MAVDTGGRGGGRSRARGGHRPVLHLGSNKIQGGKGIDTVNFDSEVISWRRSDLSFTQGNRWLKVTMGDSGDINHLRNVEFLIIEGEQYGIDSLI